MSSGGSADILWSPRAVVWRERPRRWQKLHLPRRGWVSNRLHRHLRWQSWQLPDPASWLCEHVSVEWRDLQRPLLSGRAHPGLHLTLVILSLSCKLCTHILFLFFRCMSRHREPLASVYPSAEMNTLLLLWYWGVLTARGRYHSSISPSWWWARATLCTGVDLRPGRLSSPSSTLISEYQESRECMCDWSCCELGDFYNFLQKRIYFFLEKTIEGQDIFNSLSFR